jgi:putative ABC transport system substrate-binding protein
VRRRQFIAGLGSAAAWPLAARAQQTTIPVIGYLNSGSPEAFAYLVTAFRRGLSESGYVEGRNLAIEYRWAESRFDRLPDLAADLVRRRVAAIFAQGDLFVARAAKKATATIPIVFAAGGDPVAGGLVTSLNRPGGNITGVTGLSVELIGKQLGLLHVALPGVTRVAALVNPSSPTNDSMVSALGAAAAAIGLQTEVVEATSNREIDSAFATLAQSQKQAGALLVFTDALFVSRRVQIVTLATRHSIPVMLSFREAVEAGGLMSYGPSFSDVNRQAGVYVGRILKGERPTELPVMLATKFELVINTQTARILGVDLSPGVLAIADEVIE